jgi:Enoyl-CoA hydratase/isomerase
MPETSIGFFPDVGASHFLNRLPPGVGRMLGLTGMSIKGAQVHAIGAATHFVPSSAMPDLHKALMGERGAAARDLKDVDALLAAFAAPVATEDQQEGEALLSVAARHFARASSVSDIFASLEGEQGRCKHCAAALAGLQRCACLPRVATLCATHAVLRLHCPKYHHRSCVCCHVSHSAEYEISGISSPL